MCKDRDRDGGSMPVEKSSSWNRGTGYIVQEFFRFPGLERELLLPE